MKGCRWMALILGVVILVCSLFCGCGKMDGGAGSGSSVDGGSNSAEDVGGKVVVESVEAAYYEELYRSQEVDPLLKGNWAKEEIKNPSQFMSLTEFLPGSIPILEGKRWNRGYRADSKYIYFLDTYYRTDPVTGEGHSTNYLHKIDLLTRELTSTTYENDEFYEEFQVVQGRVFAVKEKMNADGIMEEYCMEELKTDGSTETHVNLCPILEEANLLPQPHFASETKLCYDPEEGLYFLQSADGKRLFVAGEDGEVLFDISSWKEVLASTLVSEIKNERADAEWISDNTLAAELCIELLAPTLEGRYLVCISGGGLSRIGYFSKNGFQTLWEGDRRPEISGCDALVDGHGKLLFYSNDGSIVSWDTVTGEQERLYIAQHDPSEFIYMEVFARNEKGELITLESDDLRVLTVQGPARSVEFTIKPMTYMPYYLNRAFRKYEKTHPGVKFNILSEVEWDQREIEMNKLFTEFADGTAPDLLIVFRDQLEPLDKNGCLMDLTGFLREDTCSKLIPGVMEAGTIGGQFKMLPFEAYYQTIWINKKYFDKASWTVSELLDTIEKAEKENENLEYLFAEQTYNDNYFYDLAGTILETEFVDLEKGNCNFDSELFIRFLEVCKKYSKQPSASGYEVSDVVKLLKSDKALLYRNGDCSLGSYSKLCAMLGPDYYPVGLPTTTGKGSKISFSVGMVVNKDSVENLDLIKDIINCLYDGGYQGDTLMPIRTDAYDGKIIYPDQDNSDWLTSPAIRIDSHSIMPLEAKPDGSSYVDDYMDLIQSCGNLDYNSAAFMAIWDIVCEEVEGYFAGNKSAKDVAAAIQSRVSIYLMENQ